MLDQLSPELVELVLLHLDRVTLKSCLEVSKIFRDIIIHSPEIMKKLTLRLDDKNWMSKVQFINDYGSYIRNVVIFCTGQSCQYFWLLALMPKVTKLKVDFSAIRRVHAQRSFDNESSNLNAVKDIQELHLKKLEHFEASFYNFDPKSIFNDLKNSKSLKRLSIRFNGNSQIGHDSIISFLCLQTDLKFLELKIARMDLIFSGETIDKFNYRLKILRLVPSYYAECDYTFLNKFLLKQSDCLEELCVFSWKIEDEIAAGITRLKCLKSLTTHGLLPCFETSTDDDEKPIMESLTHFRFYKKNRNENFDEIDLKSMPNLKSLNVHFGINHRLFEHYPDIKVTDNPLRKLKNLKEFHIESVNQDLLHFLASPNLEMLVLMFEDGLFDIASWTQIGKNLPKLLKLCILDVVDEKFLNFFFKNYENFIQKIRSLEQLELHCLYDYVLKLYIKNGRVQYAVGDCCFKNSILSKKCEILEKNFDKFSLRVISKDEYAEKYEYMQFYFHSCGP